MAIHRFELAGRAGMRPFLMRAYTRGERRACAGHAATLAEYFALKEAVAKALGTGLEAGSPRVTCADIQIRRRPRADRVSVRLRRGALAAARRNGESGVWVRSGRTATEAYALAACGPRPARATLGRALDKALRDLREMLAKEAAGPRPRRP